MFTLQALVLNLYFFQDKILLSVAIHAIFQNLNPMYAGHSPDVDHNMSSPAALCARKQTEIWRLLMIVSIYHVILLCRTTV